MSHRKEMQLCGCSLLTVGGLRQWRDYCLDAKKDPVTDNTSHTGDIASFGSLSWASPPTGLCSWGLWRLPAALFYKTSLVSVH